MFHNFFQDPEFLTLVVELIIGMKATKFLLEGRPENIITSSNGQKLYPIF